ncbi:MAG: FAD-dependent oxidoreductase [Actinomycetota bacterium]
MTRPPKPKEDQPVILVVDRDQDDLARISDELHTRYGGHYEVMCMSSVSEGADALSDLTNAGRNVALVLADKGAPPMTGVELLKVAKGLDSETKRGLLVPWGAWGDEATAKAIVDAMTFGEIDYYVLKPWRSPDEFFHKTVTAFLHEWARNKPLGEVRVTLVGKESSRRSYDLRNFLSRHRIEHVFYLAESPDGRAFLKDRHDAALPVAVTHGGEFLENPTDAAMAEACGLKTHLDGNETFGAVVIGSGPAGLAAAVYGASEGIKTLVVERGVVGGQAGSSSMIRNYLGFARGISGSELAAQAYQQAWVFGTTFLMMQEVTAIERGGAGLVVTLSGGQQVGTTAIVLANGVSYRRLGVKPLEDLVGAGVFYGAAASEAHALRGRRVFIVGGGNSAGQAAIHLAKHAASVSIVVRSQSLVETMSDYLIKEVEAAPNLDVRLRSQVVDGGGDGRLQHLVLSDLDSGVDERVEADALFIMIGAEPYTDWLPDEIERDRWGFVLTGDDVSHAPGSSPDRPLPLETSMLGVFAAGDVRHGSIKRVASAVGEGSAAIRSVHEHLRAALPSHS